MIDNLWMSGNHEFREAAKFRKKNIIEEQVINMVPAHILQRHPNCFLYLDESSASSLSEKH